MEDQVSSATAERTFQVPPDATIGNAAAVRDSLLEAIRQAPGLTLDLSRVEKVDLSFFQIVCAGQRLAAKMNKTLTLDQRSASGPVRDAVALSGLSRRVDCTIDDDSACVWKEED